MSQSANITPPAASLVCDTPCDLITLELADNYKAYARLFATPNAERAVLYLHGIQSHSGWFLQSCDFIRQRGLTILAPDRRGSGLNNIQRGHCDSPTQLIGDVNRCVDWLCRHRGCRQIDIVAVSWSGKLALAYAHRYQQKVRSLVLVTPGLRARIDISLREKISIGADGLLKPHRLHEIPLNEPSLFTANPAMLTFIENDPLKLTYATASFFITSTRLDKMARSAVSKINIPTYLFLAGHDRIIDNNATIDLLRPILQPIPATTEPARLYSNAHHSLDFEPHPNPFFQELANVLPAAT